MTRRDVRNIAASIRQRLLNAARLSNRPFNELLQYFAIERFLYRLAELPHRDKFALKGALMLVAWNVAPTRPTRDVDLLGQMANDVESVSTVIAEICRQQVSADGARIQVGERDGERIAEQAEYEGVRARFLVMLGTARVSMQIDVGFGDAVVPGPVTIDYPTILDLPAPRIRGYTRESMVAEKFHTMVRRGIANSRIRDYFDLWALSRQFSFDGGTLSMAIRETFDRRDQAIEDRPVALLREFAEDPAKVAQWRGYLRKTGLEGAPDDLAAVVEAVASFLCPVAEALKERGAFAGKWLPAGPWAQS